MATNYIIFNGKDCNSIITGCNLLTLKTDNTSKIDSTLSRESILGGVTFVRPIAPDYGSIFNSVIGFGITFIKENEQEFSNDEIRKVTSWLTSPRHFKKMEFYEDNVLCDYYVMAKCLKCEPFIVQGINGITATFTCDSPFLYRNHLQTFTITNNSTFSFQNNSDLLEDYSYPTWTFVSKITPKCILKLTNTTTNEVSQFKLRYQDKLKMDVQNNIVICNSKLETLESLGWTLETISFPKLCSDNNTFNVEILNEDGSAYTGTDDIEITIDNIEYIKGVIYEQMY